jgi:hypothetical protein
MKKIVCSLIFILIVGITYAQFPIVYGHNTYDMIGRNITLAYDGGVYIAGAERLTSGGQLLAYVLKTDINGNQLWKRFIGNQQNYSNALGISQQPDGGIVITGETFQFGDMDGFSMKLNSCGEKIWCNIYRQSAVNDITENVTLSDGSSILLACHQNLTYNRIWLYRLDSAGNLLWQKCMEPDTNYFDETGYYLTKTNDSCLLVTGFNFFIREPGSGLGWFSPLWVKFDLEGNQIWDLTWYSEGFVTGDFGHTVQDSKSNYYMAGADGFQQPGMKASLYKISTAGIPEKIVNVYNQGTASGAFAINFYQDSTLFLGGQYAVNNTGYSMVINSDTAGNVIKTKDVPLYGNPVAYSVLTTDNKVVALGERLAPGMTHWETCLFKFNQDLEYDSIYTVPRVYDSLCPQTVSPIETINLDCIIVDTEEPIKKPENSQLKIYPQPAATLVTISLPDYYVQEDNSYHIKTTTTWYQLHGDKTIELYNLYGQKIASYSLPEGETSITFDISNQAAGMYMARLVCKGKVWANGKVMVVK